MQFLKILFKRLNSTDWKTAGAELTVMLGSITVLIADIKSKDFGAVIQDVPAFWTPALILIGVFRSIISSNDKAIKNPALPQIQGELSTGPIIPPEVAAPKF